MGYTRVMGANEEAAAPEPTDRSDWPVRMGKVGAVEPPLDLSHLTPSERVELVWELTKDAWSLTGEPLDESTFRRDVESVTRRGR